MGASKTSDNLEVVVDVGRWLEVHAGFLSREDGDRIVDGEDFDDVIEGATGDAPDSFESMLPGNYLLDFGDYESALAEIKSSRILCRINGKDVPFEVVVLPIDEESAYAATGWDEDAETLTPEARRSLGKSAEAVLELRDLHAGQLKEVLDDVLEGEDYFWSYSASWKGCQFQAEASVSPDKNTKVVIVFFVKYYAVPWSDELVDDEEESIELPLSSSDLGLYLAGIAADGRLLELAQSDDVDKSHERLLIEYSSDGYVVKYIG